MTANEKAGSGCHPTGFQNSISRADSTPSHSAVARDVLRNAITAAGVSAFVGVALLAAADSFAKARVRDELEARARAAEQNSEGASA